MYKKILLALLFTSSILFAQDNNINGKEQKKILHEVSNKDIVQSIYPEAEKVEKLNSYWYKILDMNNKIIGYAMSSATFCQTVKGYCEQTPVMILIDKQWTIKKVALLSNWETISYVRKLERKGFFDLWVGKTLNEAKKVKLDGYTGATYTALAVGKNVDFLLKTGAKAFPKN